MKPSSAKPANPASQAAQPPANVTALRPPGVAAKPAVPAAQRPEKRLAAKPSRPRAAKAREAAGAAPWLVSAEAWLERLEALAAPRRVADLAPLAQDNWRAAVDAGGRLASGLERLRAELAAFAGERMSDNLATAADLALCRSLDELLDRQIAFAKASLGRMAAEGARVAEMSLALAKESFEPISVQAGAAAERFIKALAD